jgi:hypothetical protein
METDEIYQDNKASRGNRIGIRQPLVDKKNDN